MDPNNAIEIRNMTKYFKIRNNQIRTLKDYLLLKGDKNAKKLTVLEDVTLDIKKGETVALVGSNGSGKSTLLKLMTKIIYPNSGTVETNGKLASLLELGAGFHPDFTGRENIYFNAAIFGLTEKEIEERIPAIIEFSELGPFIDEPIRTYSSGMYMRLAFSIAINVDAEIILIDEILAVGDHYFQDKCYNKLRELRDSDKTIVIVSHSLDVVRNLCRRAVWIYKGHFQLDGDPNDVIPQYLNQIARDHREELRQKREDSGEGYNGIITIDRPVEHFRYTNLDIPLTIRGWQLCDCEESRFELKVGTKTIDTVRYVERPDVMQVYFDSFSGLVDEKKVGFVAELDLHDYTDDIKNKELSITASLYDGDDNLIKQTISTVTVDYEQEPSNV